MSVVESGDAVLQRIEQMMLCECGNCATCEATERCLLCEGIRAVGRGVFIPESEAATAYGANPDGSCALFYGLCGPHSAQRDRQDAELLAAVEQKLLALTQTKRGIFQADIGNQTKRAQA